MPPINTLRALATAVRGRRLDLGLTQADVARRAAVSRQWLNEFERGKPTAELRLAWRVLDALDLQITVEPRERHASPDAQGRPHVDLDALLDDHRQR
jgi:HTH-type transcriptional regulator / antitoxin HipB